MRPLSVGLGAVLLFSSGCDEQPQRSKYASQEAIAASDVEPALSNSASLKEDGASQGSAAEPQLGRCHMGECSWSLTKDRAVVRRDANGSLLRLTLLGGTSQHPDEYDSDANIEWNKSTHTVHIFCSSRLPAVMLEESGEMQVDVLDFVSGVPGVLESSANLYTSTCHPDDDWTSDGFADRHGYKTFGEDVEVSVSKPEDILKVAERDGMR